MQVELSEVSALERSTMRKVILRLVPFLMASYFMALLDRVNIGFAALPSQPVIPGRATALADDGRVTWLSY